MVVKDAIHTVMFFFSFLLEDKSLLCYSTAGFLFLCVFPHAVSFDFNILHPNPKAHYSLLWRIKTKILILVPVVVRNMHTNSFDICRI